jgi:probable phosphoglycerate mutase
MRLGWTTVRWPLALAAALSITVIEARAQDKPAATAPPSASAPASAPQYMPPARRRIYLMRHGDVVYFDASGKPVANSDLVVLSEKGRAQADAAGAYFRSLGLAKFDRVISSNLPRTIETAERVLAAHGQGGKPVEWPELRELKSGGIAGIAPAEVPGAMTALAAHSVAPATKFIGGESIADAQARILPAIEKLRQDTTWDTALLVLHGLVNTVVLSEAVSGGPSYLGRFEQSPGCINVLDLGPTPRDWVVRAINVCPDATNYTSTRLHVLEQLTAQAMKRFQK